jgi:hypothetical protein
MNNSRYTQFNGQYADIPGPTQDALTWYVLVGQPVGDFLHAVLSNDLMGAFKYADDDNIKELLNIVRWVYNVAPSGCWGSEAKIEAWYYHRGLAVDG